MRRSDRITLMLLALACIGPVALSYFAFFVWQPEGRMNYGELLQPTRLPDAALPGVAGAPGADPADLNGVWTLVYAGPAACDEACGEALYAMRQSRIAQRRDMTRVERLWLVTDGGAPDAALLEAHGTLRVARAVPGWLELLPGAEQGVHVFIVDPRGHVMMRFPARPDVALVIRDLQRLLKFSGVG